MNGGRTGRMAAARLAGVGLVTAALVATAWAEGPATAFRRVFVPAAAPESWPTGGQRYLPLDRRDFESLVAQQGGPEVPTARLRGATYRAELVDGDVLVGTVDYQVEIAAGKPGVVALEPMNLALGSAAWQSANSPAAKWGLWNHPEGNVWGALANASGALRFDWQLRSQTADAEQLQFTLDVPPVAPQTLELLLPVDVQAVLPAAELVRTQAESATRQRWLFQLASRGPHLLKLLRQGETAQARGAKPRLSQATVYRLEPEGLDLTASIRLEPAAPGPVEMRWSLGGGLRIKGVTMDRAPVEWSVDETSGEPTLVVRLPAVERPRELEIEGMAAVELDRPWRLPAVQPASGEWTEGTSLVVVSSRLELESFASEAATLQHIVGLEPGAASAEAYRVQEWSPTAALELVLARRRPRVEIESATAIDLGASETTARVSARVTSQLRATHRLAATIEPGWSIESVKTEPASALREWHVEDDGDRQVVKLQLQQPIEPGSPLAVELDARATGALRRLPATVRELRVLRFESARTARELLLLRSRPQRQMELLGGLEAARVAAPALPPAQQALLPDPLVGELIDLANVPDDQRVALRPRRANYVVDVAAELTVLPQSTVARYLLACQPISGEIAELAVHFDRPVPATAEWTLPSAAGPPRRLLATLESPADEAGATYLVKLPLEETGAVRLEISYSSPAEASTTYNAISFPRADRWSGQVVVRGPLDGLQVDDAGWVSVGFPALAEPVAAPPLVGCYRLHAGQAARDAPLEVRRTTVATGSAPLSAWLAEYHTHQSAAGSAICSAVYHLENTGATELVLKLPPGSELQASWLDGVQLEPRDLQTVAGTFRVRLDEQGRYPTLSLRYVVEGAPLGRSTRLGPAVPECEFPIRLSRWTLWTPEQFVPDEAAATARRVPWRERLFGPLGRGVGEEVFLPWRAEAWPRLWSTPVEGVRTRILAERFANRLEQELSSGREQTWGQALTDLAAAMQLSEMVSIDVVALGGVGIGPSTAVAGAMPIGAPSEGRQLASHGLALAISPNRIVVTTADRIAHWRQQLQPTAAPRVYVVTSEELSQELEAKSPQVVGEVASVDDWTLLGDADPVAWSDSAPGRVGVVGQRAVTLAFLDEPPVVVVRRAYAEQANWYVVWLAAAVGGVWWLRRRTDRFVLALAVAAAACFVVPTHWLTVPQAVLVGLLSALAVRLVFPRLPVPQERSTQTFVPRSVPLAVMIAVTLALNPAGAETSPELPRVLIPVDAAGEPQGDDVYVSEAHRAALTQSAGAAELDGARWVIGEATITGSVPAAEGATEPWLIALAIESYVPRCEVELPLRQSDGEWVAALCMLDGKPVEMEWLPQGEGCRVTIPTAGSHQLQLAVRLRHAVVQTRSRLRLHVPRLTGIGLELTVPAEIEDLRAPAAGRLVHAAGDMWRTTLAAVEALELEWSAQGAPPPVARGDVEQLSWLRIEPAVAHLSVQFRFHQLRDEVKSLDLYVPSDLKLTGPAQNEPVARVETLRDGWVRLHMKSGWEAQGRVPLEFQLQRTSSLGHFFAPTVRLRDLTPERRLFAVSLAGGLMYHEETSEALRGLSPAEFAAAWGDLAATPLVAYSLADGADDWSLRVWPEPATMTAEQTLALHCQADRARVEYRAHVQPVDGKWLVHHLQTPAELEIDTVVVVDEASGASLPLRWTHAGGMPVTVFLGQPLSQPHQLRLRGWLRLGADGAVTAPRITLAGAERSELRLTVWREPQVLVEWHKTGPEWQTLARPLTAGSSRELLVGRYSWPAEAAAVSRRLQLLPNAELYRADTVTSIGEREGVRTLRLDARVAVEEGVVGQLQLALPTNVAEPLEVVPAEAATVGPIETTTAGRQATILLNKPLAAGKAMSLRVVGRLTTPADGRVELPAVELLGADAGRRYVLLPTRLAGEPVEWQTAGLKRESLPESLRHLAREAASELPYRVMGSEFTAREPAYQGPLRSAALRHVWVEGLLDAAGNISATASFVLQPGRAAHCAVSLPPGARLLGIVVDGQPASRQPQANGSWRVALGPPFLPRVVKVSYLAPLEDMYVAARLTAPAVLIGDATLPTPVVDWRIELLDGQRLTATPLGRKISGARFMENRYRRLVTALEDAAALALETPETEVSPWLAAWRGQIETLGNEAGRWGVAATALAIDPPLGAEPTSWTQLLARMSQLELAASAASAYPPLLPQRPATALANPAVFLSSDGRGQLEIVHAPATVGGLWRWAAAAVVLAAGVALEKSLSRRPGWLERLVRWPHLLVFGAGALWWMLFSPSIVGLAIMALAGASAAWRWWRRRGPAPRRTSTQPTPRVS